jgi:hypothetical protein
VTTQPPEPAPPAPAAADHALDDRVKSLEDGQQAILGKLDRLIGGGPTPAAAPAGKERPEVSISEEIRKQLDERDRAKAAAPPAPAAPPAADLTENPPAPLPRRIERLMGWTS